jgi:DNA-binding response OmpR family regulator
MKILVIEDEKAISDSIASYLDKEGYSCEFAADYNTGEEKALLHSYDCILLDITLPDGNGLNILKNIKKEKPNAGVIIISAKNSLDDKVNGLDWGADDYLTKPFHLSELSSRIKSVIRRRNFNGSNEIEFNEMRLVPEEMQLLVNKQSVVLTKKEYDLLLYFLSNKNRVVTKESIADHLWGDHMDMVDSFDFIYVHIKNLRKKIMEKDGKDYIQTVYGMGYRFGDK